MLMSCRFFWPLAGLALFCVGCNPDSSAKTESGIRPILPADVKVVPGAMVSATNDILFAEIPDASVIVAVGDRFLTKREMVRSVDLLRQMVRVQSQTLSKFEKNWRSMQSQAWWDVVSMFIYQSALVLEAESLGVKPTEGEIEAFRDQFEKTAKTLNVSLKEYIKKWTDGDKAFEKEVFRYALVKAYFDQYLAPKTKVTDEEFEKLKKELAECNLASQKTNAILMAKIRDYRARATFDDLKKLTGEEDEDTKILPEGFKCEIFDNLARTALPDGEEVPLVLRETPLNTFTEPIELEDTIDIYYMTNAVKQTGVPTLYSGYRIYVPKDLGYVIPDDARLMSDMRYRKNQEVVMPEIERLRLKFGTVLPYGECWSNACITVNKSDLKFNQKGKAK